MAGPDSLRIQSYQVGFGDCFLLTFAYPNRERHILIDFGSTGRPKGADKTLMEQVADDIRVTTGGAIDVVVATHRHADHISGFGGATGKIIADLNPKLVLQPWTEDLKAAAKARKAKQTTQRNNFSAFRAFDHMDLVAEATMEYAKRLPRGALREQLAFLGEENLANKAAVTNLSKMGTEQRYLQEGDNAGLGRLLPGVKTHVLGPPSLEQSDKITKYAKKNEEEYWSLVASAGTAINGDACPFAPEHVRKRPAPYARWFQRRIRQIQSEQLLQIVRQLDSVLNNTSLILLFETRGQLFLFPGDAQLENWAHALSKEKYRTLLQDVNVYKVGHHGSLNATPKSLWKSFSNKGKRGSDRLVSFMSTMDGKHGHSESRTEVPRTTLTEELEKKSDLFDTRTLEKGEICYSVQFDFQAGA